MVMYWKVLKLHPTIVPVCKIKSWLLEAAEQDKNKTHSENNGDI